jgi:hypothetical protein
MAQVLMSFSFPANPHFGKLLFFKAKGGEKIVSAYRRVFSNEKFAPLPLTGDN